ncbi:hypothetical protein [Aeoliella mucimassa]|uniref:Uncharacterized protein n=1 Tax=Aeoliella mucimassa TaxID=2527972 RepID=A0A518AHC5_9BACT|nr:hypothetical protein [Aeoliella mucimassa]QDU54126.1 hypothetical protein Pan181_03060 [Aeoliella mucimassa]
MRTLLLLTVIVAVPLACYVLWLRRMEQFFEAVFEGNSGEVMSSEDWPLALKQFDEAANQAGVVIDDLQVYCMANGLSIAYVWRMRATSGLQEFMTEEYGLSDYTPPESHRFRAQPRLPDWWDPQEHSGTHYYAANLGEIGRQYVVLVDETNEVIYVYFYDNW